MLRIKYAKLDNLYACLEYNTGKFTMAINNAQAMDSHFYRLVIDKTDSGRSVVYTDAPLDNFWHFKLTDILIDNKNDKLEAETYQNLVISGKLLAKWCNAVKTDEVYELFLNYYNNRYDNLNKKAKVYNVKQLQNVFMLPLLQEYSKLATKSSQKQAAYLGEE